MAHTIAQKLKIVEGASVLTINAPVNFKRRIEPLPAGAKISTSSKTFDQVHWFVKDQAQLKKELKKVLPLIKDDIVC